MNIDDRRPTDLRA